MARFFSEADIEEFKECFYLYATDKLFVTHADQLSRIMRSVGFSPTEREIAHYFETYKKGEGKLDFATFLEIMHEHTQNEKCQQEILSAFMAQDRHGSGQLPVDEMVNLLQRFGETLSQQEIDRVLQETGLRRGGMMRYQDFVKQLLTPVPDY